MANRLGYARGFAECRRVQERLDITRAEDRPIKGNDDMLLTTVIFGFGGVCFFLGVLFANLFFGGV